METQIDPYFIFQEFKDFTSYISSLIHFQIIVCDVIDLLSILFHFICTWMLDCPSTICHQGSSIFIQLHWHPCKKCAEYKWNGSFLILNYISMSYKSVLITLYLCTKFWRKSMNLPNWILFLKNVLSLLSSCVDI